MLNDVVVKIVREVFDDAVISVKEIANGVTTYTVGNDVIIVNKQQRVIVIAVNNKLNINTFAELGL